MVALQYLHFNSITISFEKGDDLSIPLLYFLLCNRTDKAIQSLFEGSVEAVIYTQGGASIVLKDGTKIHHKGFKVKAIDTTGAGDAFIGAQ